MARRGHVDASRGRTELSFLVRVLSGIREPSDRIVPVMLDLLDLPGPRQNVPLTYPFGPIDDRFPEFSDVLRSLTEFIDEADRILPHLEEYDPESLGTMGRRQLSETIRILREQ